MTNRRQFLRGCSALTLAAGFAPAACLATLPPLPKATLNQFRFVNQIRFADFSAQVGTVFNVTQPPAIRVGLKLIEAKITPSVHPLSHLAADARNEKFSLLFSGPREAALTQDTHQFEHDGIGFFEMFIVPVGHLDTSRTYYQAVFNRPAWENAT